MHPMLNIAVRAARKAGSYIARASERLDRIQVENKGVNDYVSEVDRNAERIIIDLLQEKFPSHSFLGEESGLTQHMGDDTYQWIIDPLDGTTNFLHGFPQFAVSIALVHEGIIEQGIVHDPSRDEDFIASRGRGAQVNNRRMRVSNRPNLEGCLLGTGMPFRPDQKEYQDHYWATLKAFAAKTTGIRRMGAAALDLAYVASARIDGFWEFGLKPWDMAAGVLLIREAGGMVCDHQGGEHFLDTGHIVTASPKLTKHMLKVVGNPTGQAST